MRIVLFCLFAMGAYAQSRIVVISHRGDHNTITENTLAAFQKAYDGGADFFELDVRTTADGKLMLMHDSTVDRTTNGKGEFRSMTAEQLGALEVKGGHKIPTFAEALAVAKKAGRGVYVDIKQASAEDIITAIEAAGMQEQVVLYGGLTYLAGLHKLRPTWKAMPEASNPATLEKIFETVQAQVVAFDRRDFTTELIARTKQGKALIYVDLLGLQDTPAHWEEAVKMGADGIQTDHPAELVQFLKQKGWR